MIVGLPFVAPLLSLKPTPQEPEETVFTPEMLLRHNYGLYIINVKARNIRSNPSYASTVAYKLGYQIHAWRNTDNNGETTQNGRMTKYVKVNFLTDGWVCPIGNTYEEVCEYLNNNPYGEKFRLMTKEEVVFLITHRTQGFL
jgi:hypothetical protein